MTEQIAPHVPDDLAEIIGRDPAESVGFTLSLLSVVDGWPHQAMLSVGEVRVVEEGRMVIALWAGSRTSRAIDESGRATITAVVPPKTYSLRLQLRREAEANFLDGHPLVCFFAEVVEVSADEAPYARLESGIRFSLSDPESTLKRWRATRKLLEETWKGRSCGD